MATRFVDILVSEIGQFKENAVPQKTKEAASHQCNSTKTIIVNSIQIMHNIKKKNSVMSDLVSLKLRNCVS